MRNCDARAIDALSAAIDGMQQPGKMWRLMKSTESRAASYCWSAIVIACSTNVPPGLSRSLQAAKEGVEVLVADRLDHLDRHQLVVLAAEVAVVVAQQRDAVLQARGVDALARPGVLFARDRGGGHAAAVVARGVQREAAPAGADLEHALAGPEVELAADAVELGDRRLLQASCPARSNTALEYIIVGSSNSAKKSLPTS